jgi:hypothetical protein
MIPVHTEFLIPYTNNGYERGIEGEVRAINGLLQVHDGSQFKPICTAARIDDYDLDTIIAWAKQTMEKEMREQELVERFPAFAKAKENYEMIRSLVENEVA